MVIPTIVLCNCPNTDAGWFDYESSCPAYNKRRINMDDKMIELLKTIEALETDKLEKLSVWIEFNLQKRKNISQVIQKKHII